jgi:hypothetical protein
MAGSRTDRLNLLGHAASFAKNISGSDDLMSRYEMLDIDTIDIGSKRVQPLLNIPIRTQQLGPRTSRRMGRIAILMICE